MIYSNNLKNVNTNHYHSSFFKQNQINDFIIEGEEIITVQPNSGDIALGELTKQWFVDIFLTGLLIKEDKENYPNSVFFFKEGKYFFELEHGDLWCNFDNVSSTFFKKYGSNWLVYRHFIKSVVEDHFKTNDVTPYKNHLFAKSRVENHFKMNDVTPNPAYKTKRTKVEDHFKMKNITPNSIGSFNYFKVENHFKIG